MYWRARCQQTARHVAQEIGAWECSTHRALRQHPQATAEGTVRSGVAPSSDSTLERVTPEFVKGLFQPGLSLHMQTLS